MEAGNGSATLGFRVKVLERSEEATRKSIGEHQTSIAVQGHDIAGLGDDIHDLDGVVAGVRKELREGLAAIRSEFAGELKWIRRGLWAAAAFFLTFTVALIAVIATVLSNG
jgi:hypothetical protein